MTWIPSNLEVYQGSLVGIEEPRTLPPLQKESKGAHWEARFFFAAGAGARFFFCCGCGGLFLLLSIYVYMKTSIFLCILI